MGFRKVEKLDLLCDRKGWEREEAGPGLMSNLGRPGLKQFMQSLWEYTGLTVTQLNQPYAVLTGL